MLTRAGALSSRALAGSEPISAPHRAPPALLPVPHDPPEFSFPAGNLDAGGKHFQLPIRTAWLRGVLEGTAVEASEHDGVLDLRVSKSGTDVVVRGTLTAELTVPCSRCLAPARVLVREELSALAVPTAVRSSGKAERPATTPAPSVDDGDEEAEVDPGEADVIAYEGENHRSRRARPRRAPAGNSDDPLVFGGMPRYQA